MDQTLQAKIDLEKMLLPEIDSTFDREADLLGQSIEDESSFNEEALLLLWLLIIRNHSSRVESIFYSRIPDAYANAIATGRVDNLLDEATRQQVNYIIATSRKDMEDSISQARQAITEDGGVLVPTTLALVAVAIYKRKQKARRTAIAITTTQDFAEGVRFTVAVVSGKRSKKWKTVLDGRERQAHRLANGQTVPVYDPFVVDRQLLSRPGDISLGATAKNIVNCRCSVDYL